MRQKNDLNFSLLKTKALTFCTSAKLGVGTGIGGKPLGSGIMIYK
jgi:hypothetical protein